MFSPDPITAAAAVGTSGTGSRHPHRARPARPRTRPCGQGGTAPATGHVWQAVCQGPFGANGSLTRAGQPRGPSPSDRLRPRHENLRLCFVFGTGPDKITVTPPHTVNGIQPMGGEGCSSDFRDIRPSRASSILLYRSDRRIAGRVRRSSRYTDAEGAIAKEI